MVTLWIVVMIASIILEAATAALITVWFALGAAGALIAAALNASVTVQYILFLVISIVTLILTRPLVKKMQPKAVSFNDTDIGGIAIVIQEIDASKQTGRVRIKGVDWPAVSIGGIVIPVDSSVIIEKREANTVFVRPLD
jgi:membrane protein implicated in regulation of membrane protease activity